MYVDRNGRWFGIDDLIVSAVAFTVSYLSSALTTGDFGWNSVKSGLITAGSAWLAYKTGGAAAGLLFEKGSEAYAITASTLGGFVGGSTQSISSQLVFNKGRIDWGKVGQSALAGTLGGLAGGTAGTFIDDAILPTMIGGSVGGGVSGSFDGNWGYGAIFGGISGSISASLTATAFEAYGRGLTNEAIPNKDGEESYGKNYTKEGSQQSCRDFVDTMSDHLKTEIDVVKIGPPQQPTGEPAHVGISLGRDSYGRYFVLSKEGVGGGVFVRTSTYLKQIYGSPVGIMKLPYYPPDYLPPNLR
ncbi:MAG: hypothetical protein SFU91_05415 [Chloroherpetonaceae bacterium]|nr:hypothetical protein [Chloroherpetonaceae bacterium]